MLARHAENLFWAGRYIERAEDTARMLDVTYHGLLEANPVESEHAWADLLSTLRLEEAFYDRHRVASAPTVSEFLVLDPSSPGSIIAQVFRARENIRSVRELVTTELWEAVNVFHLELSERNLRADLDQQPYALYSMVKHRCQTVAGVAAETMPRDDGWRFLQAGWMLERAEMMCRLLAVRFTKHRMSMEVDGGADGVALAGFHHWLGTLKSASAAEAYRKTYRSSMDPVDMLAFLLLSKTFPRSVLFCLRRAEADLGRLGTNDGVLTRPERLLGRIRSDLEYRDVTEVMGADLGAYLDQVQRAVRQVAEAVALQYFRNSWEVGITRVDFHPISEPLPVA
jgi:uncharacterized alpha-E superfamily protein